MKEQVITPRATNRGAQSAKAGAGALAQRPAKRERGSSSNASSRTRRAGTPGHLLSYLPLAGKILLSIVAGLLIFAGYRAAASASFFQVRAIDISGASRANAEEIRSVTRRAASQTGVWQADLESISAELHRLAWVRSAVVSRVLPDGLRVRITERVPRAVVRISAGRLVWVDDEAVMLGTMSPSDQMPAFFIRGWDEAETAAARAGNRERIKKYLEMLQAWEAAGLSERVSEVNLDDLRDVRAQLSGDDSQIEVRLGEKDFGNRLKRALDLLDKERNTPRGPFITYLMPLETHTVIGTSTGAQRVPGASGASQQEEEGETSENSERISARTDEQRATQTTDRTTTTTTARARESAARAERGSKARANKERASRTEPERKEKASDKAKGETRPRRVG